MSYGFSRADALYYDHVLSEPPDDWLGDPDEDENEEETETEDTEDEKVYD